MDFNKLEEFKNFLINESNGVNENLRSIVTKII